MFSSFFLRRLASSSSSSFETALNSLRLLKSPPPPIQQLQLYALYKQSTAGAVTRGRPSADPKEVAKWDAWHAVRALTKDEAKEDYVKLAQKLCDEIGITAPEENVVVHDSTPPPPPGIEVTLRDGIQTIAFNRPDK